MEGSGDMFRGSPVAGSSSSSSSSSMSSRRYGFPSAASIIQAPLSALLEYSGILPPRSNQHQPNPDSVSNDGEVSIRIIGATEQDNRREDEATPLVVNVNDGSAAAAGMTSSPSHGDGEGVSRSGSGNVDAEAGGGDGVGANGRDSSYQRYDIQHAARWIEQVLPFSLLLLVVFIRQHLQGSFSIHYFCLLLSLSIIINLCLLFVLETCVLPISLVIFILLQGFLLPFGLLLFFSSQMTLCGNKRR